MKKHELITVLAPFTDELEITVTDNDGVQAPIKHLAYNIKDDGEGIVTIVPFGARDVEYWVKLTQ